MERSVRLLLTLLALLTGLAAPAVQAGVRADAGAGVEQVEGLRAGVVAVTVAVGKLPATKRAWAETKAHAPVAAPAIALQSVQFGDRALE